MIHRAGFRLLFVAAMFAIAGQRAIADDVIEVERDIEYSNPQDQHLKLNLSRPSKIDGLAPAVVCIHGGGWSSGNRDAWQPTCENLARHGYVAVTVSYRLAPAHPFPAAVEDVQAAVRWLRANAERLQVDPDRIAALGRSAGGHFAQCLGVGIDIDRPASGQAAQHADGTAGLSCRVQCVVNFFGPNDLLRQAGVNESRERALSRFIGGDLAHARHQFIVASPYYWVTPDAAPTLIIHGTKDDTVPFEQGTLMHDRLKAAGVEVDLLPIEGAKHGWPFGGADAQRADAAMYAWLDRHLKGPKK